MTPNTDHNRPSEIPRPLSPAGRTSGITIQPVLTGWEHDWRDFPTHGHALNSVYRVRREGHEGIGIMNRNPQDGEISWHYNQYSQRWIEPGASFMLIIS